MNGLDAIWLAVNVWVLLAVGPKRKTKLTDGLFNNEKLLHFRPTFPTRSAFNRGRNSTAHRPTEHGRRAERSDKKKTVLDFTMQID